MGSKLSGIETGFYVPRPDASVEVSVIPRFETAADGSISASASVADFGVLTEIRNNLSTFPVEFVLEKTVHPYYSNVETRQRWLIVSHAAYPPGTDPDGSYIVVMADPGVTTPGERNDYPIGLVLNYTLDDVPVDPPTEDQLARIYSDYMPVQSMRTGEDIFDLFVYETVAASVESEKMDIPVLEVMERFLEKETLDIPIYESIDDSLRADVADFGLFDAFCGNLEKLYADYTWIRTIYPLEKDTQSWGVELEAQTTMKVFPVLRSSQIVFSLDDRSRRKAPRIYREESDDEF